MRERARERDERNEREREEEPEMRRDDDSLVALGIAIAFAAMPFALQFVFGLAFAAILVSQSGIAVSRAPCEGPAQDDFADSQASPRVKTTTVGQSAARSVQPA